MYTQDVGSQGQASSNVQELKSWEVINKRSPDYHCRTRILMNVRGGRQLNLHAEYI